jgi:hypothetical protein
MMLGRYKRLAIALGAAALIGGGALAATSALADTPTPVPGAPAGQQHTNYRQVFVSKLAAALGIDQSKLESSAKQAAKDTVDEAAKNGDLTQAQADQAKQRIDKSSGFPGGFGFGARGFRGGPKGAFGITGQTVMKAVADKLGLTEAQLQSELKSGKSFSDIAKEKNLTEQDLRSAAAAAVKAQLDAAVTAGKLTQAQEDSMVQRIQQGQGFGFPMGHRPFAKDN